MEVYWTETTKLEDGLTIPELRIGDKIEVTFVERDGKKWATEIEREKKARSSAASRDRAPSEARGAVHFAPLEQRQRHLGLVDLLGGHLEEVAVEDDQVGGLADLDRAGLALLESGVGAADRVSGQHLRQTDALLGKEGRPRVWPRSRRVIPTSIASSGFIDETDQSLPPATTAPLAKTLAIG